MANKINNKRVDNKTSRAKDSVEWVYTLVCFFGSMLCMLATPTKQRELKI